MAAPVPALFVEVPVRPSRKAALGVALLVLATALYAVQYAAFDDPRSTLFYLLQDLAFLPISVLVLTLIVNGVLERRERRALLHKLNMVIGAFSSETGNELIRRLTRFDARAGELRDCPGPGEPGDASPPVRSQLASCASVDARRGDLTGLRDYLAGKRQFMLVLLENPSLLEHETFSELIWAVLHLAEELDARSDLTRLGEADLDHLSGDLQRAYRLLTAEWFGYMAHLRREYPYLYSLALRLDPFDPQAAAEVV